MPIALRPDFDAVRVRVLARRSKDAAQTRRRLAWRRSMKCPRATSKNTEMTLVIDGTGSAGGVGFSDSG
jgi:hypothetical protein